MSFRGSYTVRTNNNQRGDLTMRFSIGIFSLSSHKNCLNQALLVPLYRWGNQGLALTAVPAYGEAVSGEGRVCTQARSEPQANCWTVLPADLSSCGEIQYLERKYKVFSIVGWSTPESGSRRKRLMAGALPGDPLEDRIHSLV